MALQFTPHRFRRLALAGMGIVLGLTVASYWSRQGNREPVPPLPPQIAPEVNQQTQQFSLSKTLGDNTLYTVQAKRVTYFKDTNKVQLHGVSILVYGKDGKRQDRIESEECEFDPNTASLFISGEVRMEFEAPLGASFQPPSLEKRSNTVRILTSGLRFDQNTGTASTDREVRFWFAQGQGSSEGAIYDPQRQWLALKAKVEISLQEPTPGKTTPYPVVSPIAGQKQNPEEKGMPGDEGTLTRVRAGSLRFPFDERKIELGGPVEVTRGSRRVEAGSSEILLDDQHRARKAFLAGGVIGIEQTANGSSEVRSQQGLLELTAEGKLTSLQFENEVSWMTSSAEVRREGSARRVDLLFSEPSGLLTRVLAADQVRLDLRRTRNPAASSLPSPARRNVAPPDARQVLSTETAEMKMSPDGNTVERLTTPSASTLELYPSRPGDDQWTVQGDGFGMDFDSEGNLARFSAGGSVRLSAESTAGPSRKRVSTSDYLSLAMDPQRHSIARMEQWGRFRFQDPEKEGRSERAVYSVDRGETVLQGNAAVWNPNGKLSAQKILLQNDTGNLEAEGAVSSTYFPQPSTTTRPSDPIHVVADHLRYEAAAERAHFQGRVHLWQGSDLLEAGWLELDRRQGRLEARNQVYSIFQDVPQARPEDGATPATGQRSSPQPSGPVEIRSDRVLYQQPEQKAIYQGSVRMQHHSTSVTASELELFFQPAEPAVGAGAARIERALARGQVNIRDAGRKATGNRAEYFPARSQVVLFGEPAAIVDPQRGTTAGARLTYHMGDDRILVEGEPGLPTETRRQVSP